MFSSSSFSDSYHLISRLSKSLASKLQACTSYHYFQVRMLLPRTINMWYVVLPRHIVFGKHPKLRVFNWRLCLIASVSERAPPSPILFSVHPSLSLAFLFLLFKKTLFCICKLSRHKVLSDVLYSNDKLNAFVPSPPILLSIHSSQMKWTYIPSYAVFSCFLPVKYNSLSVVFIKSAPLNAFAPSSPILFSVHFFINHYCFVHCILVSVSHVQVSEQLMLCSSSAIHLTFSLLHMWFCFLLTTSHNYCFCCVDNGLYICCLTGQIKLPNCMIFQCEKDAQPHNFMVSYLFSCCNLCEKLDNWWHNKKANPVT